MGSLLPLAGYLTASLLAGALPSAPILSVSQTHQVSYQVWQTQQSALSAQKQGDEAKAVKLFSLEAKLYWVLAKQPNLSATSRHTLLLDTAASLTDAAKGLKQLGQYAQAAVLYAEAAPLWKSSGHLQTSAFSNLSGQQLGLRLSLYALQDGTRTLPGGKFVPPRGTLYLGAYTELDRRVGGNYFAAFDALMQQHFSAFLEYLPWGDAFPARFVADCVKAGAVPQIAWEPTQGLGSVRDSTYVRDFLSQAAAAKVPIFLRFAGEMNGSWVPWHGDAAAYVAAWRRLDALVKAKAPNVAMVWAPDVYPEVGAMAYYPGSAYVDWVGVSDYLPYASKQGQSIVNASGASFLGQLGWIYQAFAGKKPIMIAEGAAAVANRLRPQLDLTGYALAQYQALLANFQTFYPDVRAIFLFDVNTMHHPNRNFSPDLATADFSLTDHASFLSSFDRLLAAHAGQFAAVVRDGRTPPETAKSLLAMPVPSGDVLHAISGGLTLMAQVHAYGGGALTVRYKVAGQLVSASAPPYRASFRVPAGQSTGRATLLVDGKAVLTTPFAVVSGP